MITALQIEDFVYKFVLKNNIYHLGIFKGSKADRNVLVASRATTFQSLP